MMLTQSALKQTYSNHLAAINSQGKLYDKPHFFSIDDYSNASKTIESILALPNSIFVEKFSDKSATPTVNFIGCHLFLSLTTASCYNGNVAHLFTKCLNRFELNDDRNLEITTCLHEAIMNAMLHGNLKMVSDFRTLNGLYRYQAEIEHRLTVDSYKSRRVTISAWQQGNHLQLAVSDEGSGFNMNKYRGNKDTLPHGRGLPLIHSLADSVWLENDRRTLFMRFEC